MTRPPWCILVRPYCGVSAMRLWSAPAVLRLLKSSAWQRSPDHCPECAGRRSGEGEPRNCCMAAPGSQRQREEDIPMAVVAILGLAIGLQVITAVVVRRLIRITGRPWGWVSLAAVVVLLTGCRCTVVVTGFFAGV